MKAVAKHWSPSEVVGDGGAAPAATCSASAATTTRRSRGIEALIRALEADEFPFKQAEAAEKRLRALKERFLLGYRDPDPKQARLAAGSLEHRAAGRGDRASAPG